MTSPKGGGRAAHDGPGKVNEELGFLPWIALSQGGSSPIRIPGH